MAMAGYTVSMERGDGDSVAGGMDGIVITTVGRGVLKNPHGRRNVAGAVDVER